MPKFDIRNLKKDDDTTTEIGYLILQNDLKTLKQVLKSVPPHKIADFLVEQENEVRLMIFEALEPETAGAVFDFLTPGIQQRLLCSLPNTQAAYLLNNLTPDDRTAFLEDMPHETINELIKYLPLEGRVETLTLLGYPPGSVGRLMTPDYIAIRPEWTIQHVLDHLLEYGHDSETISLLYVVDNQGKLLDDVRLRDFLFIAREKKVESLMDGKFIALSALQEDETAISIFRRFDRIALPVIDKSGVLLGIVTIDDVLRLSDEEATKEIQKIGGQQALEEPYMETPFLSLMRKRAGWLTLLFLGEMLTATALGYFEAEIAKAVVLALFLPLIISSGGNAGGQATTLIIRAMALDEIKLRDWWRVIKRELASGLFLGLVLGTIGFVRIALWSQFTDIYGEHWLLIAMTIFLSLVGVVLWGTLSGAILPLILRSIGVDPATASAPFVATVVDVTGVVIYFLTALFILQGTML